MKRRTATARTLIAALMLLPLGACADLDPNDVITGIYFVKLDAEPAAVADLVQEMALDQGIEPLHVYDSASEGFTVRLPHELAPEIETLAAVDYVIQDEKGELLPPEEVGEPITLGPDETPEGIERAGGPYGTAIDWSGIAVAVIDTGVDSSHADLNVVSGNDADMVCQSKPSDCAKGGDPQGHGTHVAGTIGAYADGSGVVGMAPGVPIHAVRVLGKDGSGYVSDILAGIEYVLDHPEIKVANMSLGGPAGSSLDADLEEALTRLEDAGVVVAIAAGNEGQNTRNVVPAGLNKGIVVSAYDASGGSDNGWAWFSNFGDAVDIAAPGVSIVSTWPNGEYATLDGTSMAAPHVAGAAAVYMALNPNAGPNAVRNAIKDSAEEGISGQGGDHPEGMLDLGALAR
jgi:subtilisin family serine protease